MAPRWEDERDSFNHFRHATNQRLADLERAVDALKARVGLFTVGVDRSDEMPAGKLAEEVDNHGLMYP